MSGREIKIDVWKYTRPILMGLGAVLEKKLDNQGLALRLLQFTNEKPVLDTKVWNRPTNYLFVCVTKCAAVLY